MAAMESTNALPVNYRLEEYVIERVLGVGASLGVAELTEAHADAALWLAEADAACYAAKRGGRGAVRERAAPLRLVRTERV